ncbi:DUF4064 domain-containing protein [Staphylococcus lugdunensis]|uniref:DUF4064 domain-containing protein n=1 Tax=Staphylococcus lugdunensis TaxID=28035 RepID=UPI0001F14658|nr:DUF4064 domain-containing protein [Staphylococcus lugdunensis]EFU83721.1 hypothetical protein HMPREF0790_1727 [Staphylococcus lugdunensis M23590]SQE70739.1 membrane protein [Staphylococcus lugdunensis]
MIKRTVETVLTWSGIILHAVYFFILLLMSLIFTNDDFKKFMIMKEIQRPDENVTLSEAVMSVNVLSTLVTIQAIINIVILVLAIIGVIFIHRRTNVSAILLIIAAVLCLLNASWVAFVLWLIASIMLFARKPKTQYDYSYNNMSNPSQEDANDNEHSQS